jgi:endoglucanase
MRGCLFVIKFKSFKSLLLAMVLMFTIVLPSLGSVASAAETADFTQMNLSQMAADMGAGWNLGNQLDASSNGTPNETAWGNPVVSQALIQKIKSLGFKTIRIPVTYMSKIGPGPSYTIDSTYMARVKQVVDYAYNEGLFVILNIHHDGASTSTPNNPGPSWLQVGATDQTTIRAKYKAVWQQIANTFVNYNEHLILESMNEVGAEGSGQPNSTTMGNLNALNQIFVDTVRQTGGNNAARWLLLAGWYTDIDKTAGNYGYAVPTDNYRSSTIPSAEKRLFISVHYYSPWQFVDSSQSNSQYTQWGAIAADPTRVLAGYNEAYMDSQLQSMYNKFSTQGYGVIIGEFGAADKTQYDSTNNTYRAYYAKTLASTAKKYQMVPVLWDTGTLVNRTTLAVTEQGILDGIMSGIGNYYKIINRNSGKALDVNGGSTADGAAVVQWPYTGGYNQQWELINVGRNNYELINRNSGKPLEISGWSTADGALAQQWTYTGLSGYNQQWQMIDLGGGYFEFKNANSGKYLEIGGWSTTDGTQASQWTLGGQYNTNQQWQLVVIE